MSNLLTFGKHEGRSFEWLFFHDPQYAEWMYNERIHRDRYKFTPEETSYLEELMRRASGLKGMCRWCKARWVTRLGIVSLLSGGPDHVGFFCDRCEYPDQGVHLFGAPSFFVEYEGISPRTQRQVTKYIQDRYIREQLTQANMENFFRTDEIFVHATPGFFAKTPLVASG